MQDTAATATLTSALLNGLPGGSLSANIISISLARIELDALQLQDTLANLLRLTSVSLSEVTAGGEKWLRPHRYILNLQTVEFCSSPQQFNASALRAVLLCCSYVALLEISVGILWQPFLFLN